MDPTWLVVLVVAGLGVWMWTRRRRPQGATERQLQHICLGDRAQMERLIALELSRAPGITRVEAVERAVERHRRDNR